MPLMIYRVPLQTLEGSPFMCGHGEGPDGYVMPCDNPTHWTARDFTHGGDSYACDEHVSHMATKYPGIKFGGWRRMQKGVDYE